MWYFRGNFVAVCCEVRPQYSIVARGGSGAMQYLFGDYTLDTSRCELRRTGRRIQLRPKVFDVLSYLIAERDHVVSQQDLLEHLWPQQYVGEATLKSCIKEARQAVGFIGKGQSPSSTLFPSPL